MKRQIFATIGLAVVACTSGCATLYPEGWEVVDASTLHARYAVRKKTVEDAERVPPAAQAVASATSPRQSDARPSTEPQVVQAYMQKESPPLRINPPVADARPVERPTAVIRQASLQQPAVDADRALERMCDVVAATRDCKKYGLSLEEAKRWLYKDFSLEEASRWRQAGFTAAEARWWKDGGHTTDTARNRIEEINAYCQDFLDQLPRDGSYDLYEVRGRCFTVVSRTLDILNNPGGTQTSRR